MNNNYHVIGGLRIRLATLTNEATELKRLRDKCEATSSLIFRQMCSGTFDQISGDDLRKKMDEYDMALAEQQDISARLAEINTELEAVHAEVIEFFRARVVEEATEEPEDVGAEEPNA